MGHAISNNKREDVLQKQFPDSCIYYLPLTFSLYFLSVLPASLVATQIYSPLSEGVTEAMISSVPSSRTEIPGSLPVSSLPLRSHLITGFGIPNKKTVTLQETVRSAQNKKGSNNSHCLLEVLLARTMHREAMSFQT